MDVNEEQHQDVLWYCVVVAVSTGPNQQHPIKPHGQQEGKGWGHFAKEETWFGGSGGTRNGSSPSLVNTDFPAPLCSGLGIPPCVLGWFCWAHHAAPGVAESSIDQSALWFLSNSQQPTALLRGRQCMNDSRGWELPASSFPCSALHPQPCSSHLLHK